MRTKLLLSVLFTASLCAVFAAAVSGRLPSPWDGGTAEARSAVLQSGVFAPVAGPAAPNAAAASELISFQGRLTNPTNSMPIPDNSYSIVFRVFDADTAGIEVWTETQTVSVAGGLFSVYLGATTPFPAGAFDGTARYLEVQVGADPAMTPRLLFTSVAYAFRAVEADTATTAGDLNCSGCVDPAEVQFNYAGSNVPGGPATDVTCLDCIAGSEAQFNYAGSASEGGPANNVACDAFPGCINSAEIVDNSVGTSDVQFNYAGSTSEGGPASDLTCANFSGCVDPADVQFNYAGSTTEGGAATDVSCANPTGCISGAEITDGQVASADITDNSVTSGDIADNSLTNTDVAINYAGSTTEGGAASDLACTSPSGCVDPADVQFNYAGSTTEGGVANDSQTLDTLDSAAFLRSDAADAYTGSALSIELGSQLRYRNAGFGLRLSVGGSVGSQFIYFFDGASETGQSLSWDDTADLFQFSNDLDVNGNIIFGSGQGWVDGGLSTIATAPGNPLRVDNAGLCVDDGVGAECPGVPAGDGWFDGNVAVNAFDIAESFPVAGDALEPGDLVVLEAGAHVRRSSGTPYDSRMAGVVSANPGLTLGWESGDDAPVALAGRVPLKVTLENGPIAAGDHLTSSTTPGRAMKATEPGATVGIALQPFDGSQGDTGEVLTFVSLGDGVTAEIVRELQQRVGELEAQQPGAISADSGIGTISLAAILLAAVLGVVVTSAATTWFVLRTARVARS